MASSLPDYVASARPVPQANRIPWYKSTAQTYAGIMLWFVFWVSVPVGTGTPGGTLTQGLFPAFVGLIGAALLCHAFYYLAPGMLGLKTGLPLYIVGTSTYGVRGGFLMPGFLMGLLQFGWLGVNAYFASLLLTAPFYEGGTKAWAEGGCMGSPAHMVVGIAWAVVAAFVGLKGIKYVARVATFFPLIPLTVLIVLTVASVGGLKQYGDGQSRHQMTVQSVALANQAAEAEAKKTGAAPKEIARPLENDWAVMSVILTGIIGFFATAGAAGTDFGMNNRNGMDVQLGGLVGIAGATIFAGGLALVIVAGANGLALAGNEQLKGSLGVVDPTALMDGLLGKKTGSVFMYLLAIAAFPPACFSSLIAANSFKTTLPKVNPFISVGIGTAVSILLVVTGWAGQVGDVFNVIGASFGPICGAMAADYLLAGKKWAGPRAAFNPAGWISWAVGFVVGAADLAAKVIPQLAAMKGVIPVPPLAAMIVGFVLYIILAKIGLESRTLEMPAAAKE
jgi:cytosine permease